MMQHRGEGEPGCGHEKIYTWEEIKQHTSLTDRWVVINGVVYDVTRWQKKHPGGARILSHFAGKDASEPFSALHKDKALVAKHMKSLVIGTVCPVSDKKHNNTNKDLIKDFHAMRQHLEAIGLFKPSVCFYSLHFIHIILLEVVAILILRMFGVSWPIFLLSGLLLGTAQVQAGWLQHDMGHVSVFSTTRVNRWGQFLMLDCFKGATSLWWNFRHNQHHARTNIVNRDPDVTIQDLFLLGSKQPVFWGQRKRNGYLPYNWQQIYFWLFGPPFSLPVFFVYENLYFLIKRKEFARVILALISSFRACFLCGDILGIWGAFCYVSYMRIVESIWFIVCSQINHITMEVDEFDDVDWITANAMATCNVEKSFFNDWLSGHLNFQIEHHLFPQMPRHNYYKAQPYVKALFKKHGLVYVEKSLMTGVLDIYRCLKKCGQLWYDSYNKAARK